MRDIRVTRRAAFPSGTKKAQQVGNQTETCSCTAEAHDLAICQASCWALWAAASSWKQGKSWLQQPIRLVATFPAGTVGPGQYETRPS